MRRRWLFAIALGGCAGAARPGTPEVAAPLSRAADAQLVAIPAGRFIVGSTPEERGAAYDAFLATAGKDVARRGKWFEREDDRHVTEGPAFRIDLTPVTNAAYAEFVAAGGAPAPTMDAATWQAQGFDQKWPEEVERFVWRDAQPPPERADHPVVLVTWAQARDYCAWRGRLVGEARRLPTEAEFEKAARGTDGRMFPWGDEYAADKLDSRVTGPDDTMAVGSFTAGASPFGVLDLAGNVYQWTSTPWPPGAGPGAAKMTVKGSAWDDWGGLGRGAQRHGRPIGVRHAIVGFRCAADAR
ncbi:MAG: formylglycine-generating enzyme family protein [Deltaproteobacteria bacterium]|nr:formylglycine-generating enzyme family protein [Deltaproteobacteria bacterium]